MQRLLKKKKKKEKKRPSKKTKSPKRQKEEITGSHKPQSVIPAVRHELPPRPRLSSKLTTYVAVCVKKNCEVEEPSRAYF